MFDNVDWTATIATMIVSAIFSAITIVVLFAIAGAIEVEFNSMALMYLIAMQAYQYTDKNDERK